MALPCLTLESAKQLEQDSNAYALSVEINLDHAQSVADLVGVIDFPTSVIAFWHGCSRGISRKTAEQRVGGRICPRAEGDFGKTQYVMKQVYLLITYGLGEPDQVGVFDTVEAAVQCAKEDVEQAEPTHIDWVVLGPLPMVAASTK